MTYTIKECEELYLDLIEDPDQKPTKRTRYDIVFCETCNVEKVYNNCFTVCPECGVADLDELVYEDMQWVPPPALYKRRLYCQEKLKLYAGHKMCKSPHYRKIVKRLKSYDVDCIIELKQYLKEWKLKRFYKYIYNLYFDVTGLRLINLTSQDIDFLSRKFIELETRFKMTVENKRKNMYNYNSCLFLLMKHYGYGGYEHILLPLNHLQIARSLRRLII